MQDLQPTPHVQAEAGRVFWEGGSKRGGGRAGKREDSCLCWWQGLAGPFAAYCSSALAQVLILNPAFLKYIHETWLQGHGRYPSTGFTALLFALHACQQVSAAAGALLSQGEGFSLQLWRIFFAASCLLPLVVFLLGLDPAPL